uniref:Uncharacterized protein n=1 Tax=Nymphaea colorata TaxID=210225 RepID=A0A5K1CQC4_9MAGN
MRKREFPER